MIAWNKEIMYKWKLSEQYEPKIWFLVKSNEQNSIYI